MNAKPTDTIELPLNASATVELVLTAEQVKLLGPLLALQRCHDRSAIFILATQSYVPSAGAGVARLQVKVVDRKTASKVAKILSQADLQPTADS